MNSAKWFISNGDKCVLIYPIMLIAAYVIPPAMSYPYTLLVIAPNDIMHIMSAAIISTIAAQINLLAIAGLAIVCWSGCLCLHARCLPSGCNPCIRHDNSSFPLHMNTTATAPATSSKYHTQSHTKMILHFSGLEQVGFVEFHFVCFLIVSTLSDVGIITVKNT